MRRRLTLIWPLFVLGAACLLVGFRAWGVDQKFAPYVGCTDCFFWPVVASDAWLLAALCILLLLAVHVPVRWLSRLIGIFITLAMIVYVVDMFVLQIFGSRLYYYQLAVYGQDIMFVWDQYATQFPGPVIAAVVAIAIIGVCLLPTLLTRRPHRGVSGILVAASLASLATAYAVHKPVYVNSWIYRNLVQVNWAGTLENRYSEQVANHYQEAYYSAFPDRCIEAQPQRSNVIIVIIESWSAYQSQAFGGIYNWTPRLDQIARRHTSLTRFYANGSRTNAGLANLLGGVRLVAPFRRLFESIPFESAWGLRSTLPQAFNKAGYQTAFLTTGPLSFTRKGEWMRDTGFNYVEGNKHPFYDDWPAISFQAAPDEALYRRALAWIETSSEPFMLTLETVSTHQPYTTPAGERNMEAAFRYADHWAAWFYERLAERGYFDAGGILIITSDHRSMNPVLPAERERFGPGAASRIPLIWVEQDSGLPHQIDTIYKLSDLLPTFKHHILGKACLDAFEASLFERPVHTGNCAFHKNLHKLGIVDVFCGGGTGRVRLDGDDTRFVEHHGLGKELRRRILTVLAHDRLQGAAGRRSH